MELSLDLSKMPRHLAIIMDGNGRWAKQQGKKRSYGHQEGVKKLREIIKEVFSLRIPYLSLYIFSVDNWKRENSEISFLMKLISQFYKTDAKEMSKNGIRVVHSGIYPPLPEKTVEILKKIQDETRDNQNGTLNICINYGGRIEITEGIKKLIQDFQKNQVKIDEIDPELFSKYLFHPQVPDVDLLIRTSGEIRISDFMLWRIAYSELWFTNTLWPDFSKEELHQAISDYQNRERRFGGILK